MLGNPTRESAFKFMQTVIEEKNERTRLSKERDGYLMERINVREKKTEENLS